MTSRPLIGLPGRRKYGREIVGMQATFADTQLDLYFSDFALGVIAAGGLPVHLPINIDPSQIVERLDGVLLPGGADIGPDLYGAAPEPETFAPEPERDEFELALLTDAVTRQIPVLGICRGLQILNVYAGGTLHQDVPPHAAFEQPPETELHDVSFEPGSVLEGIYGTTTRVNSLHHQTVDAVGTDLRVNARADDGVIEGLEHIDLPIVSVQWHPEMMTTRDSDPIFAWLVEAASHG